MARKHVMTAARRTALRKAQLASAAKRHGVKISTRPNAVIVRGAIYKRITPTTRKRKGLTKTQKAQFVHSAANLAGIAVGTTIAIRMNRAALTGGATSKRLRYGNYVRSTRGTVFRAGQKAIGK